MVVSRAELLVTVLVYAVSLLIASLSNVWLSVWGRRLFVLNSYFRSHQPLLADDENSVRIDPFDLAALEASMSAAASATSAGSSDVRGAVDMCDNSPIGPSPVFDLGLHFLPHFHYRWLPDVFVFVLLPILLAAVFVPAAARYRRSGRYWPPVLVRLCCALQSHTVVLLMRSSTTLATVHRASPVCHALSLESSSNPGFVLNTGCFDLMFSGHTAFCVLAAFFVCHRPELGWMGQSMIAVLAAAGSVSNVVVGDHFTADCLVGAHIALLACCLFRQRFKESFTHNAAGLQQTESISTTRTASLQHAVHPTDVTPFRPPDTTNRHRALATIDTQLMDVDEQHTLSTVHDGMDVESSDSGWSERDECVEEKELQQLINRWQLADSHITATAAAKRHTRRHTDIR